MNIMTFEQCKELKIDNIILISCPTTTRESWKSGLVLISCSSGTFGAADLSQTYDSFTLRFAWPLNEIYTRTRTQWTAFHWKTALDPTYMMYDDYSECAGYFSTKTALNKEAFWPVCRGQHFHLL